MGMPVQSSSAVEFLRTGCFAEVRPGTSFQRVRELWGDPTAYRLTSPPSRIYGPVWLFVSGDTVTHAGIYIDDLASPAPPGFTLDVPIESVDAFRTAVAQAGLRLEQADDEMVEGDPEVILRVPQSGVMALFNAAGRLSCIVSRPINPDSDATEVRSPGDAARRDG